MSWVVQELPCFLRGGSSLVHLALRSRSLCGRSRPVWGFWCRSRHFPWSSSAACPGETSHRQSCPCMTPLRKETRVYKNSQYVSHTHTQYWHKSILCVYVFINNRYSILFFTKLLLSHLRKFPIIIRRSEKRLPVLVTRIFATEKSSDLHDTFDHDLHKTEEMLSLDKRQTSLRSANVAFNWTTSLSGQRGHS